MYSSRLAVPLPPLPPRAYDATVPVPLHFLQFVSHTCIGVCAIAHHHHDKMVTIACNHLQDATSCDATNFLTQRWPGTAPGNCANKDRRPLPPLFASATSKVRLNMILRAKRGTSWRE